MEKNIFVRLIAENLKLSEKAITNTLKLLDEGCTIPFIARYRKEATGGLDEVQIAAISEQNERLKEISKRKETVIKTITDLGKMTPELQKRIDQQSSKISIFHTSPSVGLVPKWLANKDWSRWLPFCCCNANVILNTLPYPLL